jgi:HPt (histidine-containing phosphotransfer) domain-containing protein
MELDLDYRTQPVLDAARLERAAAGDRELVCEVVNVFVTDMGELLRKTADTFDRLSDEEITGRLHKLKGGAGNVGGLRLAALLQCMMQRIHGRREKVEAADLALVQQEFDALAETLRLRFL